MRDEWADQLSYSDQAAGADVDRQLAAMLSAAAGPVDWRTLRSAETEQRWVELRQWVEWFRREFVFYHRVVPPCWYRHSALVSVLSALRDHWVSAYDSMNAPIGASDWHRVLMQLEPRLRDWASRTGCSVGAHRQDLVAEYPDDREVWTAHVAADVDARAAREAAADPAPVLTSSATIGPADV